MRKNKKGYTILELLAVIMILGILISLAYMGISKYLNRTKEATYKTFEENITSGVTNFLIDHSTYIPRVGESLVVDVKKLVCEGYIDNIEDPDEATKTCNLESYAIVTRKSDVNFNMDIEYTACLKCSGYESPACSNSIAGIRRLEANANCEVD